MGDTKTIKGWKALLGKRIRIEHDDCCLGVSCEGVLDEVLTYDEGREHFFSGIRIGGTKIRFMFGADQATVLDDPETPEELTEPC